MMTYLFTHIPTFLAIEDLFQNAAKWILDQAAWVILAALVVLGLQAWMNGRLMALFGGIIVAGILLMFASGGGNMKFMQDISGAIETIFKTGTGGSSDQKTDN